MHVPDFGCPLSGSSLHGNQHLCEELTFERAHALAQVWVDEVRKCGYPTAAKAAIVKSSQTLSCASSFMENYSKLHNKPSTQRGYWAKRW